MVRTLQESTAELGKLVERASQGEDVLITVGGEVKARLTAAESSGASPKSVDTKQWVEELRARRQRHGAFSGGRNMQEILDEMREERT